MRRYLLAAVELLALMLWSLTLTRPYVNFDPNVVPAGSEFLSAIQSHHLWTRFAVCGLCAMWNGSSQGGFPAFADPYGSMLHPLVALATLGWGVINGSKLVVVAAFLIAGLGQWWLAHVLGLGRTARLWSAAMAAVAGSLAAKMEAGNLGLLLSTASFSLVLPPLVAVCQSCSRRAAVLLGLTLALVLLSGQGYVQIGTLLTLPAALLLVPWGAIRPGILGARFGLAVLIAVLLAAAWLVPLVRLLPVVQKTIDVGFSTAQPIPYIPLNLVIGEEAFYRTEALGKKVLPYAYFNFVGWVAVLLAAWGLRGNRSGLTRRAAAYFTALIVLAWWLAGASGLVWLARELPVLSETLEGIRFPPVFASLAVPGVLSLSALGVDQLVSRGPSRAKVSTTERGIGARSICVDMRWLLPIPLLLALIDARTASSHWIGTLPLSAEVDEMVSALRTPDLQWVNPPSGEVLWIEPAIRAGLKLSHGSQGWYWRDRPAPEPVLQASRSGVPPGMISASALNSIPVFTAGPGHDYAAVVHADGGRTVCTAQGVGGDIDVTCRAPTAGILTVKENNWSGWQASVDGHYTPLGPSRWLTAPVPAGSHSIAFRYRPWDVPLGFLLTLCGVLLAIYQWRKKDGTALPAVASRSRASAAIPNNALVLNSRLQVWRVAEALRAVARRLPSVGGPASQLRSASVTKTDEVGGPGDADGPGSPIGTARVPPGTAAAAYERHADSPGRVVHLPGGAQLRISVEPGPARRFSSAGWLVRVVSLQWVLFAAALVVYALTRLWALDQFPIYFFADEAVNPLLAEGLLARGFRDAQGNWFPLYFDVAAQRWTPLLSVYVHALSVGLFGKSLIVTRATSAVVSVIGAAAVGLILKTVFNARYWWTASLFLAITPAWFLHSRTAFETVMMASFFACFLLLYLLYRTRSPLFLFAALPMGAATFYVYSNAQVIMVALGLLLLLSDIRYHLQHRRMMVAGLIMGAILLLPVIQFRLNHSGEMETHLRAIDSYWFRSVSVPEKLIRFAQTYLYGLSPQYWFFPNERDLARHRMLGYGHIRIDVLPLVLAGALLCVRRIRSSPYRAVLLTALATPAGAALADIGITRVLSFVIPASILASLGLELIIGRVARPAPRLMVSLGAFALLSVASVSMLRQALIEGPLWFRDYGLYGIQYGAKQLFQDALPSYLQRDPSVRVLVSSTWANGTDNFLRFFLSPEQAARVQMGDVDGLLFQKRDLAPNMLFVMTSSEYGRARNNPMLKDVQVEQVLPYPDGTPGFYFARLAYSDNADALFAAEREARSQLVQGQIEVGGQVVRVRHSRLDGGALSNMFDGDRNTLARGMEANPFVVELAFPEPRATSGLGLDLGSMDFGVEVKLYAPVEEEPVLYATTFRDLPPDPHVDLVFDRGPPVVARMRIEIMKLNAGETANVHVREISLR